MAKHVRGKFSCTAHFLYFVLTIIGRCRLKFIRKSWKGIKAKWSKSALWFIQFALWASVLHNLYNNLKYIPHQESLWTVVLSGRQFGFLIQWVDFWKLWTTCSFLSKIALPSDTVMCNMKHVFGINWHNKQIKHKNSIFNHVFSLQILLFFLLFLNISSSQNFQTLACINCLLTGRI